MPIPSQVARGKLGSRWQESGGWRLHSRCSLGHGGLPVVLVHGLVISSLYMVPLGECLAADHDVHALDLPGFGASEGPARALDLPALAHALLDWMTAAGIPRCHLVANSLGCQVVAHAAVFAPERFATLTLIGATIDPEAHRLSTQIFRLLGDALREPAGLWLRWLFDFGRAGLRRALDTTRAMFLDRIEIQLARIGTPTLVMRGEWDPTMPQRWAENACKLLQEAELTVVPGAPHCAHFTQPEYVSERVRAHLRRSGQS